MISSRYIPAVCALLAITLVPTLIHSYAGAVVEDQLATAAIPPTLAGYSSAKTVRDPNWGGERFDSFDWTERRYTSAGDEVLLTAIRSYDLKRLYHHPELDVAYSVPYTRYETRRFAEHPDIPVHVLSTESDSSSVAMYALLYEGGFVEHPVMFQIRTAGELLFGGRKPMTLIFVRDVAVSPKVDLETLPSARILFEAIEQFAAGAR